MSGARRRDTTCELRLRKQLHAMGLRYRVNYPVPDNRRRTIDVAFTAVKVAVFVDGCFWHGCSEHGVRPQTNSTWWATKIDANRARDADTTAHLEEAGWEVIRLWEHDDPARVATLVSDVVHALRRR